MTWSGLRDFLLMTGESAKGDGWIRSAQRLTILVLVLCVPLANLVGDVAVVPGIVALAEPTDDDEDGLNERVQRDQTAVEIRQRTTRARHSALTHIQPPVQLVIHHGSAHVLGRGLNSLQQHLPLRC